jgi:hypothetical protein
MPYAVAGGDPFVEYVRDGKQYAGKTITRQDGKSQWKVNFSKVIAGKEHKAYWVWDRRGQLQPNLVAPHAEMREWVEGKVELVRVVWKPVAVVGTAAAAAAGAGAAIDPPN